MFKRFWKWLSHLDTVKAVPSLVQWICAAGISVITVLVAWLRDQDPIVLFGLGMIAFAVMVIFFERCSAWRHRKKTEPEKTADEDNRTEQNNAPTKHNDPIHEAIMYVARRIGENDADNCFPYARKAIRQAALDNEIAIRGRKELEGKLGYCEDVHSWIERPYWSDHVLNEVASHPLSEAYDHTQASDLKTELHRNRYWTVRVNMDEIKKKWP